LRQQLADGAFLPVPLADEHWQRFSVDISIVGTSRSSQEEEGDDDQQSRQDDEDAPDATGTDHISADGEVKPHYYGDEQVWRRTGGRKYAQLYAWTVSYVRKAS
jgi:hypothetical protein